MAHLPSIPAFRPNPPDAAGIVTWIHVGDLHMTRAGEQNHRDLIAIVAEVNAAFASSAAFVFFPGDVAEHGSAAEYGVVREAIDRMAVPWCAIVGDHDVQEKSFDNFQLFMTSELRYSFQVGVVHFIALNAFDIPDPGSFTLLPGQLDWLEEQLRKLNESESAVLLLHCYPSDLKEGGERIRALVAQPRVRLIDMGHTHYNELANDGCTLYAATRSTGQIEEGPVGFSVINLDGPVVSWKFFTLNRLPAVMITSPADERLVTDAGRDRYIAPEALCVRAKAWSQAGIRSIVAYLGAQVLELTNLPDSNVWEGTFAPGLPLLDRNTLRVTAEDEHGRTAEDEIRLVLPGSKEKVPPRADRDQDNAVAPWLERGLLGTQLGPNKNGRKW